MELKNNNHIEGHKINVCCNGFLYVFLKSKLNTILKIV